MRNSAPRAVAASLLASAASAMAMRPGLGTVLWKGCPLNGNDTLRPGLAPRAAAASPSGLIRSRLPGDCSSELGDDTCAPRNATHNSHFTQNPPSEGSVLQYVMCMACSSLRLPGLRELYATHVTSCHTT